MAICKRSGGLVHDALLCGHALVDGSGHPLLHKLEVLQEHKKFKAIVLVFKGCVQLSRNVPLAACEQKCAKLFVLAHVCVEIVCDFELILLFESQKIGLKQIPNDYDLFNIAAYVLAVVGPRLYADRLVSTVLLALDVGPFLLD